MVSRCVSNGERRLLHLAADASIHVSPALPRAPSHPNSTAAVPRSPACMHQRKHIHVPVDRGQQGQQHRTTRERSQLTCRGYEQHSCLGGELLIFELAPRCCWKRRRPNGPSMKAIRYNREDGFRIRHGKQHSPHAHTEHTHHYICLPIGLMKIKLQYEHTPQCSMWMHTTNSVCVVSSCCVMCY